MTKSVLNSWYLYQTTQLRIENISEPKLQHRHKRQHLTKQFQENRKQRDKKVNKK